MTSTRLWVSAAAEVLEARTSEVALHRLAEALRVCTGIATVSRISLSPTSASFFVDPPSGHVVRAQLPSLTDLMAHPVTRLHAARGDGVPATMDMAMGSGHKLRSGTMAVLERLQLSLHQLSIPVDPFTDLGRATSWVLVSEEPIRSRAISAAGIFQPLLRSLDRHISTLTHIHAPPDSPLTPREQAVLHLLSEGLTADTIARRLAVSPRTVHKHLENLYRKLGTTDRLTAVMEAQARGWLPHARATNQSSRSSTHSWR